LPLGVIKSKNFLYYVIVSRYEFFIIPTDDIDIKNRTPREEVSDLFLSLLNKEEVIRE
jgi:hypothetical protein